MYKPRLFAPGPTVVPPETLLELARPVTHHRTAEFRDAYRRVAEKLRAVPGRAADQDLRRKIQHEKNQY